MGDLIHALFPCFGTPRPQPKRDLPRSNPFQERPRLPHIPHRGSMATSMYYMGVSPAFMDAQTNGMADRLGAGAKKATESNPTQGSSPKKTHQSRTPEKSIMTSNHGIEARDFAPRARQSRSRNLAFQHIRFRPDLPTRPSQLGVISKASPVDDSVFSISSPGNVSPISASWSPMKLEPQEVLAQSAGLADSDKLAGRATAVTPAAGQLTPQRSKPGRPSLTVRIPESTRKPPVKVTHQSASSSIASSPLSANTTPISTPAHARRLPAQEGTKTAKIPKKVNLRDELALFSLSSSEEQSPSFSAPSSESTNKAAPALGSSQRNLSILD